MPRQLPIPLSVYVPSGSVIHRIPSGIKLVTLIAFVLGVTIFARTPLAAGVALAVASLGYLIARIPVRTALWQMFGAVPLLLFLAIFQGFSVSWSRAAVLFMTLLACVVAATLLTLTTRVTDLMDTLDRAMAPLARFGVPVETISLAVSLTLRMIPLQVQSVREVLDARRARGAKGSVAAFGVPLIIRTVRRSRATSDALLARGVGDS